MAAADFWQFIPTPYDAGSPKANPQISPGITHSLSRLYLSDIRHGVSVQVLGFAKICPLTLPCRLYPLAVRQASALPTASSRFHLAMDTLAVQLTLPLAGCVEDFHLLVSAPCRAHKLKTLWPIGSEGKWNPITESSEQSHKYAMPRLRGRWCKAVIDSVHHCIYNLPRI